MPTNSPNLNPFTIKAHKAPKIQLKQRFYIISSSCRLNSVAITTWAGDVRSRSDSKTDVEEASSLEFIILCYSPRFDSLLITRLPEHIGPKPVILGYSLQ